MLTKIDKYTIQKVLEKRLEKNISQEQLAFMLDVSQSFIAKVETGKYDKKYNVAHLNELAKILGCSPKDFLPEKPLK